MTRYVLDTNAVSELLKGQPRVLRRLGRLPIGSVVVSAVTHGELRYGLALRGYPDALTTLVNEFLRRVDILVWGSQEAEVYGNLRAVCRRKGIGVGALDLLIAAQAVAAQAVLVTSDRSLRTVPGLRSEDWTK